jgi:epoxide hydrolase-like predicted phosphatase
VAIRAVVFDIGGVLERVEDSAWPEVWITRWERRRGLPDGTFAARMAAQEPRRDVVTGGFSEAQLRALYADVLGLDEDQAHAMMAEMWDAYCGELDEEMCDFARGLRDRCRTGILSNSADGARREEQRRYGFEQLVDEIVYSHEVGLAKPDPRIYRLTEERLGVAPAEIVFLDDTPECVEGARKAGWHAFEHRTAAESIRLVTDLLEQPPS